MRRTSPGLVSVVLSVRNASPWITDQLEAITSQQLGIPFEVIVADNGSTDDTVERSRAFERLGQGFRIVDASARRGKQYGQRRGVQVARGELVAFADGDDVATPGWLQALVDASTDFDMVGGPLDIRSLNTAAVIASHPWIPTFTSGLAEAMGSGSFYAAGSNCAIWRSVFLEIDEPERDLPPEAASAEDVDLGFRLMRAGASLGFAPEAVMAYRLRGQGRSVRAQLRAYGIGDAMLVKRYRALGAQGDSLPAALKKWGFLLPRAAKAKLEGDDLHWARSQFAVSLGRLEGSVRFGVLCL